MLFRNKEHLKKTFLSNINNLKQNSVTISVRYFSVIAVSLVGNGQASILLRMPVI